MPLFRGVVVTVHTPFALDGLPETPLHTLKKLPTQADDVSKFASVFIPAHAQSLFWLSYSTEIPSDETFFVFRLLINHQHVVTWCCDADEDWKGKVQFALFKKEDQDLSGGAGMEKRVLQFGDVGPGYDEDRCVEVRVFRASTKKRIPRQLEHGTSVTASNGIQLPEAGKTKRAHPRKFYVFGLLDPKDDPYATFRFYYRTEEEIASLNRRASQTGGSKVLVAPGRKTVVRQIPTGKLIKMEGNRMSRLPQAVHGKLDSKVSSPPPSQAPCTPPMPTYPSPAIPRSTGQVNLRRLSIPPSTILRPLLEHGPLPVSPRKSQVHTTYHKLGAGPTATKKENAGGKFRSLLQGAMLRRSSPDTSTDVSHPRNMVGNRQRKSI